MTSTSDAESTVRRYFAVVADLTSSAADLRSVLAPDARLVEYPNPVAPQGAERGVEETVAGFEQGKALLSAQSIDIDDLLVLGERVAVRSTWRATVGVDRGPFRSGTELVAHMGGFLTVRHGQVVEHATYDCYEPFALA